MDGTIQTFSGKRYKLLHPEKQHLHIDDIAKALSQICRFTGHTSEFYSVAQHSVFVSQNVSNKNALWGLLHDSAEAYLGDIASPLKHILDDWSGGMLKALEEHTLSIITGRYDLPWPAPPEIKETDLRALVTERRDLMGGPRGGPWSVEAEPFEQIIVPWPPDEARDLFLSQYYRLTD